MSYWTCICTFVLTTSTNNNNNNSNNNNNNNNNNNKQQQQTTATANETLSSTIPPLLYSPYYHTTNTNNNPQTYFCTCHSSTLHYVSTKQSFNATTVSAIISITITPNLYSTSSKRTLYAWCNFFACLYYLTL